MFKNARPKRNQIGMSASELKTLLRRKGHKVPRNFYANHTSIRGGKMYRFRWWSADGFRVDIASIQDFDRWANSIETEIAFEDWV